MSGQGAAGDDGGVGRRTGTRACRRAVCGAACIALTICGSARAAVMHQFLPETSKALTTGVPAGEAPISGRLSGVNDMAVDQGQLWITERMQAPGTKFFTKTRTDRFDDESGVFVRPQLDEEAEMTNLEVGVAVAHVASETQVILPGLHAGSHAVAVYDGASGKLKSVWTGAHTAAAGFGLPEGVAVDDSSNIATKGDVYIAAVSFPPEPSGRTAVNVFKPEPGGAEPAGVAAPALLGTCPTEGTTCAKSEVIPFAEPTGVAVSGSNGDVLVTDAHKLIDVFEPVGVNEYKYVRRINGTPTGPGGANVPFGHIAAVAVDGIGDVYVGDRANSAVDQFSNEATYRGRLTGTPGRAFGDIESIAADPTTGHVFVGDFEEQAHTGTVDAFGPTAVIPDVVTQPAGAVAVAASGQIGATLNGTVNPLSAGSASCSFLWDTTEPFAQTPARCEPESVPNGSAASPVRATLTGLAPDTTYRFRLTATNKNGTNAGEPSQDQQFTTPGPGLDDISAADIGATSATLGASVNPHKNPTVAYFDFGPSAAYGQRVPLAPGVSLGSGEGDAPLSEHLQGLAPNSTYHYRVVAVSELKIEGVFRQITFTGPDRTLTTQSSATSTLPDGRRWELVSPPDMHGGVPEPIIEAGLAESSPPGSTFTYLVNVPTEQEVQGYSDVIQVMAQRGEGGSWSSHDIPLPHSGAVGAATGNGTDYRAFSDDLALAVVEPLGPFTSLIPEAFPQDTERTPYIRHDATCAGTPTTCFEPLVTGAPGYADVPGGTEFGGGSNRKNGEANFVGATPDLANVLLSSKVALTGEPTAKGHEELYEWNAGAPATARLRLVSELPANGGPVTSTDVRFGGGSETEASRHAISSDGARIFWSEFEGGRHLYMRDMKRERTVQLDAPQAECLEREECGSGEVSARFQLASTDGSRVFFTDEQRLTGNSGAARSRPDLYECAIVETGAGPECVLTDLTPVAAEQSAGVRPGLLGASDDGSFVYFAATGVLASNENRYGAKAVAGESNLYVLHFDAASGKWPAPRFLATLSAEDSPDWSGALAQKGQPSRVSPDGHWLAFMSNRSLTGFDNQDAKSGQRDEEVYLFHLDGESLVCASCNRNGARPLGAEAKTLHLVAGSAIWPDSAWLAANIPAWTPYMLSRARYQSRYLSNSGRLFFNSRDALAPQDINGNEDVYEFEPAGVGDCAPGSATFNAGIGGCTALISSGTAPGESAFLDASEDGSDVFFLSAGRMSPADLDSSLDVYDAHVCNAAVPCPNPPEPAPPCASAETCRSAPQPPPVFGSPASTAVSGAGNLAPQPPTPAPPVTVHHLSKLAKALASCRKRYAHARKRRIACERRARKAYGARHRIRSSGR